MEIRGLDVSSFQGEIQWDQAAAAGYRYAVLRSIKKMGTDSRFEANYKETGQAGLKRGVYAFSYALTEEEARREARRLLRLLNGRPLELPVFADMEWEEQRRLGKQAVTDILLAFLKEFEGSGYSTGIYCNMDWYANVLDVSRLPYDYWIASYGTNSGNPEKKPSVPGMVAWQYTSRGKVPGIETGADLDLFYKEYGKEEVLPSGWKQIDGRWSFYLGNTGEPVKNDWYRDGDTWYWFDGAGFMVQNSWYEYQGSWYYLTADGSMARGLLEMEGKWYYMDEEGKMATRPITLIPGPDGALKIEEQA